MTKELYDWEIQIQHTIIDQEETHKKRDEIHNSEEGRYYNFIGWTRSEVCRGKLPFGVISDFVTVPEPPNGTLGYLLKTEQIDLSGTIFGAAYSQVWSVHDLARTEAVDPDLWGDWMLESAAFTSAGMIFDEERQTEWVKHQARLPKEVMTFHRDGDY